MIVTLSGITGIGKSFFKNQIVENLGFKNLVIVTTRPKRKGEIEGIDKQFVTEEEFSNLKIENKLSVDFEFLGARYAYKTEDLKSNKNQVTEVHYNTIYDFKKSAKDVFSIYMIPTDFERAKQELKKRELPKEVEEKRVKEIEEQAMEFENNEELRKQFDLIYINDYTDEARKKLLKIVQENTKMST